MAIPYNPVADARFAVYRKVTLASLTQSPLTVVNKFLDQTAFRYIDTTEATAGFTNASRANFHITHSWGTIFVALDGAQVLQLRLASR